MTDEEYEQAREFLAEHAPDALFLESPNYRSAIIGFCSETGRVIYDKDKCIEFLMREDGASFEQASEFFSYNTERALAYLPKDVRPIIATKGF